MVIGAAPIVVTSVNVGVQYVKEYITQTQHHEFGYARAAAEYIDGDRISHYAQTLEKDEYYEEVSRYFNIVQKQTNLKYYYVCISTEDGLIYMGRR